MKKFTLPQVPRIKTVSIRPYIRLKPKQGKVELVRWHLRSTPKR